MASEVYTAPPPGLESCTVGMMNADPAADDEANYNNNNMSKESGKASPQAGVNSESLPSWLDDENDADNGGAEVDERNDEVLEGEEENVGTNKDDGMFGGLATTNGDTDCPYCHQTYRSPRVLSCLHSLCEDCIIAQLEGRPDPNQAMTFRGRRQINQPENSSSSAATPSPIGSDAAADVLEAELEPSNSPNSKPPPGVIRCPVCKQESQIGNDVYFVQRLLLNHVTVNQLDTEALDKMAAKACGTCSSNEKAVAHCQSCAGAVLCQNCVHAHTYMRCFEGHTVVRFSEIRRIASGQPFESAETKTVGPEKQLLHRPIYCSDHKENELQYVCLECEKVCCETCVLSKHNPPLHHVQEMNASLDNIVRQDLRRITKDAEDVVNLMHSGHDPQTAKLSELNDKVEQTKEVVNETFDKFGQMLQKRREELLEELDRIHQSRESETILKFQTIANTAEKLSDACRFANRLIDCASTLELLVSREVFTEQLRLLYQTMPNAEFAIHLNYVAAVERFAAALPAICGEFNSALTGTVRNDLLSKVRRQPLPYDEKSRAIVGLTQSSSAAHLASSVAPPPPVGVLPQQPQRQTPAPNFGQMDDIIRNLAAINAGHGSTQFHMPNFMGAATAGFMPAAVAGLTPTSPGFDTDFYRQRFPPTGQMSGAWNGAAPAPIGTGRTSKRSPTPPTGVGAPDFGAVGSMRPSNEANTPLLNAPFSPTFFPRQPMSPTPLPTLFSPVPVGLESQPNRIGVQLPSVRRNEMAPMKIIKKFGLLGPSVAQFNSPHGFCLGFEDQKIVVADTNNHRIQVFTTHGDFVFQFGISGKDEGQLWYPRKVAVINVPSHQQLFVVCDRGNERSRMQLFQSDGSYVRKIVVRFIDLVAGIAVDADGAIIAVDSVTPTVFRINAETGELIKWFDISNTMTEPSDIAVFQKEYFVCDFKAHCVCVFSEDGLHLRKIGNQQLTQFPNGIDVSKDGDVLIGDSHGNRFHVVVCKRTGELVAEFECPYVKVSRCCGLRVTHEGYVVTLAKNNHHVLVLDALSVGASVSGAAAAAVPVFD